MGRKVRGTKREEGVCNPFALFSGHFVCTRDFIREDTNGFVAAKGSPNRKRPHLPGEHTDADIQQLLAPRARDT